MTMPTANELFRFVRTRVTQGRVLFRRIADEQEDAAPIWLFNIFKKKYIYMSTIAYNVGIVLNSTQPPTPPHHHQSI